MKSFNNNDKYFNMETKVNAHKHTSFEKVNFDYDTWKNNAFNRCDQLIKRNRRSFTLNVL